MKKIFFFAVLFVVALDLLAQQNTHRLRLFLIGNSFSQNASRFLPRLSKEGGDFGILNKNISNTETTEGSVFHGSLKDPR